MENMENISEDLKKSLTQQCRDALIECKGDKKRVKEIFLSWEWDFHPAPLQGTKYLMSPEEAAYAATTIVDTLPDLVVEYRRGIEYDVRDAGYGCYGGPDASATEPTLSESPGSYPCLVFPDERGYVYPKHGYCRI